MNQLQRSLLFLLGLLILTSLACGLTANFSTSEPGETAPPPASVQDAIATALAQEMEEFQAPGAGQTAGAAEESVAESPQTTVLQYDLALEEILIELYERVNPSVVQIFALRQMEGFGDMPSSGSGFVYDNNGRIVTNNHVIEGADQFEIIFANGERRRAEVIGQDIDSDLAVLQVTDMPAGVQPIPLGNSNDLRVGQLAVAIGSPFGEAGSMTMGIVSGLGRSLPSQRLIEGTLSSYSLPQVVQTDAPINPGNSGGPLLNLEGEVIGVNSAIRSTTRVNSGVGFAIPVNAVHRIVPSLIENGEYLYPHLGVSVIPELSLEDIEALGRRGAYVTAVLSGSPADRGGLRGDSSGGPQLRMDGDLIVGIDGQEVNSFNELITYLVFETEVGQTVEITVLRGGETMTLPVTLGPRP